MIRQKLSNDRFTNSILTIALPVAAQSLMTSLLNALDTIMIARLGDTPVAAVGLGNQVFFVYIVICFGVASASAIFFSQYWGKRDLPNLRKTLGIALGISVGLGLITTALAFFIPKIIMRGLIDDTSVIEEGSKYLKVVCFSYILTAISNVYAFAMRSMGNARTPLVATTISVFVNTVMNYILIFGKLGLPAMGVAGAALGTCIARVVELSVLMYSIKSYDSPLSCKLKALFDWDMDYLKKYLKTASPIIVNEMFWSLGQVVYSKSYAALGKQATAAVQVYNVVINLAFVLVRGFSSACTVTIGNMIGEGVEESKIYSYAKKYLRLSILVGMFIGLIIANTTNLSLKFFDKLSPEVYSMAKRIIGIMGYLFFLKTFNSTVVVGVMRGGGDTKMSMLVDMGSIWLVGVPMAIIGSRLLKLPIEYLVLLISLDEVSKAVLGLFRVKSRRWIHNVTV